eukprot:1681043-Rhodomonas_salina.3
MRIPKGFAYIRKRDHPHGTQPLTFKKEKRKKARSHLNVTVSGCAQAGAGLLSEWAGLQVAASH